MPVTNNVTYTLPGAGDELNESDIVAKGAFTVAYCYGDDGKFQSASIVSSNITTSGGTGGNTIYNNKFDEKSSNTFHALKTNDGGSGDHIGASITFNPDNGQLDVKFQELQDNTKTGYGAGSDYNQLRFTFVDTAVKSSTVADLYTTTRQVVISDLTIDYDRVDKNGVATVNSISDIGGNDDTLTAACYCKGTLIATATGEVAIEDLVVGDKVMTAAGELEPVIWLGNSTIHCERQLNQDQAYPIRILKDTFGANLPKRDLYVSPYHSLYLEGVMIPAYCLINGTTITQERTETWVTYYHVELPKHNAILAEGMPAESYLETSESNRNFFKVGTGTNVTKLDAQYPECPEGTPAWQHIWDTQGYAKLTQSGPILEAVKAKLAVRVQEFINNRLVAQYLYTKMNNACD